MDYEIEKKLNDIAAENRKKLDEIVEELARMKTPQIKADDGPTKGKLTVEDKNFGLMLRGKDFEKKTLTVGDDASAGFMCPPQLATDIYSSLSDGNPLRPLFRRYETSKNSLEVLKRSANGAVVIQGSEIAEITETVGLAYEKLTFTPATQVYLLKVSNIELEDNAYNAEQEFASAIGEAHAIYEAEAMAGMLVANIGDGTRNTYKSIAMGSSTDILGDALIALTYAIPTRYLKNARFVMNRQTAGAVRLLKDVVTGQYLWNSLLTGGDRDRLCGFPVTIADYFPEATSGKFPIAFGDLSRGAAVCDRFPAFQLQRLAERYAEFGITGFLSRFRTISGPLDGQAIQFIEMASS